jgi:hypothetical protein
MCHPRDEAPSFPPHQRVPHLAPICPVLRGPGQKRSAHEKECFACQANCCRHERWQGILAVARRSGSRAFGMGRTLTPVAGQPEARSRRSASLVKGKVHTVRQGDADSSRFPILGRVNVFRSLATDLGLRARRRAPPKTPHVSLGPAIGAGLSSQSPLSGKYKRQAFRRFPRLAATQWRVS